MRGQCYCGSIQYEISEPLKFVVHDHCTICQRIHGAAFVTWAGVKEAQWKLLKGESLLGRFQSTPEAERQFCSRCGSHLFFRSTKWKGEVHVTVATLTDKLPYPPKAHVYYSDRVDWFTVADDLPKCGGKTGIEPLS